MKDLEIQANEAKSQDQQESPSVNYHVDRDAQEQHLRYMQVIDDQIRSVNESMTKMRSLAINHNDLVHQEQFSTILQAQETKEEFSLGNLGAREDQEEELVRDMLNRLMTHQIHLANASISKIGAIGTSNHTMYKNYSKIEQLDLNFQEQQFRNKRVKLADACLNSSSGVERNTDGSHGYE